MSLFWLHEALLINNCFAHKVKVNVKKIKFFNIIEPFRLPSRIELQTHMLIS